MTFGASSKNELAYGDFDVTYFIKGKNRNLRFRCLEINL